MYPKKLSNIVLFLMVFACSDQFEEEAEIEDLRSIFKSYSVISQMKILDSIYFHRDSFNLSENENLMHQVAYLAFKHNMDRKERRQELKNLTRSTSFQNEPPILKFYIYYSLAALSSLSTETEESLEYNFLANQVLQFNSHKYPQENQLVQNYMRTVAAHIFSKETDQIQEYEEGLDYSRKHGNPVQELNFLYNLSVANNLNTQFSDALFYGKQAIKMLGDKTDNLLYVPVWASLADAYYGLKKYDSVTLVHDHIDNLYQLGKISEKDKNIFLIYTLDEAHGYMNKKDFEQRINYLTQYFPFECKNQYELAELYKAQSIFYQKDEKVDLERKALMKAKKVSQLCDEMDEFQMDEAHRIYQRLIEIDIQKNDSESVQRWYKEKKNLDDLKEQKTHLYLKLSQYYSEREKMHASHQLNLEQEKVQNNKRINMLYIILISLFILALLYISYLFFKNIRTQKNLKEGRSQLQIQNQIISDQNSKMSSLINALEDSNEKLKNYAALVAHDIKSPIASIFNNTRYIYEKYKENLEQGDENIFKNVNNSTQNLIDMINVLLDYSSKDKVVRLDEKVDVKSCIEMAINNLANQIQLSNAKVIYPKDNPLIKANYIFVEQLFLNIVNNALKFSKENVAPEVKITYEIMQGKMVKYSVIDNGVGINIENQEKIFDLFQRQHKGENFDGLGIGLATCKKIIQEFNGYIWVESELGIGSTFYFTLPLYNHTANEVNIIPQEFITYVIS